MRHPAVVTAAFLLTVALASFFEEYDIATLTSALKHISASLRIEELALVW